jgi:hypothetical protein
METLTPVTMHPLTIIQVQVKFKVPTMVEILQQRVVISQGSFSLAE